MMTTRDGHRWLVVYAPRGTFVARRDSPAAKEARQLGAVTAKHRTLRSAYARLMGPRSGSAA